MLRRAQNNLSHAVEEFFVFPGEKCPDDSCKKQLNHEQDFHCIKCHSNVIQAPEHKHKYYYLSRHCKRYKLIEHDLSNPPHNPVAEKRALTELDDKTIFEAITAYHTAVHSIAFKTQRCYNDLTRKCCNSQHQCSSSKCEAINKSVFYAHSTKMLKEDIDNANHIVISFDCSNHRNIKMLPVLATYFDERRGMQHRLLDLIDTRGEKAKTIAKHIKEVVKRIPKDKIIGICADNAPVNFGGVSRGGKKNVFRLLLRIFGKQLVGVGCLAHVINNAIQNAAKNSGIDLPEIIRKTCSFFNRESVNSQLFLDICNALGAKEELPRGFSKTRWLSLLPCLIVIIDKWDALKIYFGGLDIKKKYVQKLKQFYSNDEHFPWLLTIRNTASHFHKTIEAIEGKEVSLLTSIGQFKELKAKCDDMETNSFVPELALEYVRLKGWSVGRIADLRNRAKKFYSKLHKYLIDWSRWTIPLEAFSWAGLKSRLDPLEVISSIEKLNSNFKQLQVDIELLKDEIDQINVFVEANLHKWKGNENNHSSSVAATSDGFSWQ